MTSMSADAWQMCAAAGKQGRAARARHAVPLLPVASRAGEAQRATGCRCDEQASAGLARASREGHKQRRMQGRLNDRRRLALRCGGAVAGWAPGAPRSRRGALPPLLCTVPSAGIGLQRRSLTAQFSCVPQPSGEAAAALAFQSNQLPSAFGAAGDANNSIGGERGALEPGFAAWPQHHPRGAVRWRAAVGGCDGVRPGLCRRRRRPAATAAGSGAAASRPACPAHVITVPCPAPLPPPQPAPCHSSRQPSRLQAAHPARCRRRCPCPSRWSKTSPS